MVVYIREAHARDTWPMGEHVSVVDDPTNIGDRLSIAKRFQEEVSLEVPMYVDGMSNAFEEAYAAWPERFYVLVEDRVAWIAQPKRGALHPSELESWLVVHRVIGPQISHVESASCLTEWLSICNLLVELMSEERSCENAEEMMHEQARDCECAATAGTMKYLGAFLMVRLSGKDPTAANLISVFEAGGIHYDEAMVDLVLTKAAGRSTEDLIQAGLRKLGSCNSAGNSASSADSDSADEMRAPRPVVVEEMSEPDIEYPDLFD